MTLENFTDIYEKYQDKKVNHIDGKVVRCSVKKSKGKNKMRYSVCRIA